MAMEPVDRKVACSIAKAGLFKDRSLPWRQQARRSLAVTADKRTRRPALSIGAPKWFGADRTISSLFARQSCALRVRLPPHVADTPLPLTSAARVTLAAAA